MIITDLNERSSDFMSLNVVHVVDVNIRDDSIHDPNVRLDAVKSIFVRNVTQPINDNEQPIEDGSGASYSNQG